MVINFNPNDLANDIRLLEERGINPEVAKELAQFKRVIDYAAHSWYDLDSGDLPEDVFDAFDGAHSSLEQAYEEVIELLPFCNSANQ